MIIGITGLFASGKDTVGDYLVSKGFGRVSLSDLIREALTSEGEAITRESLREKGNELREKYGDGYLAKKAREKIENQSKSDWIIPSIRHSSEVAELRKIPDFILLNVSSSIETRFERLSKRNKETPRKEDLAIKTIEDLRERERLEMAESGSAQQLGKVAAEADVTANNDGTIDDLYKNVDNILEKYGES
jgi:dephospho-CoA kinase